MGMIKKNYVEGKKCARESKSKYTDKIDSFVTKIAHFGKYNSWKVLMNVYCTGLFIYHGPIIKFGAITVQLNPNIKIKK